MVSIDDFLKLDIRVAKIIEIEEHPKSKKPMYIIKLDVGDLGIRTIVSAIANQYKKDDLLGRKIIYLANLDPKDIAHVESQGMLLAAEDESGNISLLCLDKDMKEGSKIH